MRGELWALLAPEGGTDQAGVCICGGGRVGARGEELQNAVKSGGILCGERSYLAVGGHTCFEITGSSQRCRQGQCRGGGERCRELILGHLLSC